MFEDAIEPSIHIPEAGQLFESPAGPGRVVTLSDFLHRALPPLPHGLQVDNVDKTLRRMRKRSSAQKPITLEGHWRGFSSEPSWLARSEAVSYRHLEGAVNAITNACGWVDGGSQPRLRFEINSRNVRDPSERNAATLPDAAMFRGPDVSWQSIVVCGEHQKYFGPADASSNANKVVISMSTCMQSDPRRRFVLGYTIENATMRLWYYDRAQVIVSEPFDFIRDHGPFIHLVISCLYATPTQLGWDPTMVPLSDGLNYDITVSSGDQEPRTYRTLELLSRTSVGDLRSKGTRVWKAVLLENDEPIGAPVVLKDVWADPMLQSEGSSFEAIRKAAEATELPTDSFLTVLAHGDVALNDTTRSLDCTRSFTSSPGLIAARSREELLDSLEPNPPGSEFIPKVHYRIVFAEVCHSVHQETSPAVIFRALAKTALALRTMHLAGWVHRDVSSGNILVDAENRVKLSDFEYSKPYGKGREFEIGTSEFISTEVTRQAYNFEPVPVFTIDHLPVSPSSSSSSSSSKPSCSRSSSPTPPTSKSITTPRQPSKDATSLQRPLRTCESIFMIEPIFRHNPLHDLESLWWIAVESVVNRQPTHGRGPVPQDKTWRPEAQRAFADRLFATDTDRYRSMVVPGVFFRGGAKVVHPLMSDTFRALESLRLRLVSQYTEAEKDIPAIDCKCADDLYAVFASMFRKIAKQPQLSDLTLAPFPPLPRQRHDPFTLRSPSPFPLPKLPSEPQHNDASREQDVHDEQPSGAAPPSNPRKRKRAMVVREYDLRSRAKIAKVVET